MRLHVHLYIVSYSVYTLNKMFSPVTVSADNFIYVYLLSCFRLFELRSEE